MDLDNVNNRLKRNFYDDPLAFPENVRLTFRNAMTYIKKGHDVYENLVEIAGMFESWLASILVEVVPPLLERKRRLKDKLAWLSRVGTVA
ncbi:hypothetical protein BRADI_4g25210v3 [Brachypodium distachyon]|uniref:Bromo domain-containing protein n=1 Tax=Brachypodium distachyon TaxID=15368 RepID=I1INF6_BRADI|nr:hypothetical protein BRADI_4g25210v3 [Brachypodium distachyon]